MTDSSEPSWTEGVTVERLAKKKGLPVEFLTGLRIWNLSGGSVAIWYGDGNRVRIRSAVSAKGSRWAPPTHHPIRPYGEFRDETAKGRDGGFLIITEGESDSWALWYHGYPALGIPGTTMVKTLEAGHVIGVQRLYVVREPDNAGNGFPPRVHERIKEMRVTDPSLLLPAVFSIVMPDGIKDPADLHIIARDASEFRQGIDLAIANAVGVTDSVDFANSANSANPWELPIPFDHFDPPPFPTETLTPWVREFVEAEAIATQTPPDLAAMLALSAIAVAVAKRGVVKVRDEWEEPLNIYTVTMMASGSRKSAVFRDVMAPIEAAEENAAELIKREMAEALEEKRLLEDQLRDKRKKVAKGEADQREALDLAAQIADFEIPLLPRMLADDVTPEGLEMLLAEHGGRMGVFSPEGDIFDIMAGRYSASGTPNLGIFLKGHAGDNHRVNRAGPRNVTIRKPGITMGLAVQPDVIEGLASRRQFRGRGLTPRFLYSLPESNIGRREVNPPSVPRDVRQSYEAHLHQLLSLVPVVDQDGNETPNVLNMSNEAVDTLLQFASKIETELPPDGELGDIVEWGSKLVGGVVRLAGLSHLADLANLRDPWTVHIDTPTIERAIRIGEYLIPHAKAAFATMGMDPAVTDAQHLLRWIKNKNLTEFTIRDLFEGVKGRFKKVENLKPGVSLLAEHGYIRRRPDPPKTGPGRPPSPTFDVNPLTRSQNSQNSHNPPNGL